MVGWAGCMCMQYCSLTCTTFAKGRENLEKFQLITNSLYCLKFFTFAQVGIAQSKY